MKNSLKTMSFILLNFAKSSFYLCLCLLFACSTRNQYKEIGVFENIKQEFAGVDFSKKTTLLVFSDNNCNSALYQLTTAKDKIRPNTQVLGLYLKMNPKANFGYQNYLNETKSEIKWVSMQNRKLFGFISECTKSNASPFIIEIKNNQITSVKSVKDIL